MNVRAKENKSNKNDYDRFFKKKDEKKTEKKIFNMQEQNFPILINQEETKNVQEENLWTNNTNTTNNTVPVAVTNNPKSFANIASIPKNVPIVLEEVVKPGCVSMQYDKLARKIIVRYGEKTCSMLEDEKKEKIRNSLHYRMNKAVEQINQNRINYMNYYDDIHGEGAYEEKFVYKTELFDEEEEEETDDETYNFESN